MLFLQPTAIPSAAEHDVHLLHDRIATVECRVGCQRPRHRAAGGQQHLGELERDRARSLQGPNDLRLDHVRGSIIPFSTAAALVWAQIPQILL